MHTQATFLTNFFKNLMKNDITKANGKNNNSSDKIGLSFASLMITIKVFSDFSVTSWNQIVFQKSSTKNSASSYEAFEEPASLKHMLLNNADSTQGDQSFQKSSAMMLIETSTSDYVNGQYTPPVSSSTIHNTSFDQSIDIHPFYHTGYHRHFIELSATVAQCLGLVDGSEYYSVEQIFLWVCRPFIDKNFKHGATLQTLRL